MRFLRPGREPLGAEARGARGPWRWISLLVGPLAALLAVELILSATGGVDGIADALGRADPVWTVLALAATGAGYLALGLQLRRLARPALGLPSSMGLSLVWFGLGNVLPGAPAPGLALLSRELRGRGVAERDARLVAGLSAWFNARTFVVFAAASCLLAIAGSHPPGDPATWLALALSALAAIALTAWLASRPQTSLRLAALLRRALAWRAADERFTDEGAAAWHARLKTTVGPPRARARLVALGLLAWVADAACLWLALRAVGVRSAADVVLLAQVAGIAASALPLLPAGVGVVEAIVPAVLQRFGAPLDPAVAGTLLYRVATLVLPAVAGAVTLAALRAERRRRRAIARRRG